MKIFINSYNRPDVISTPMLLDESGTFDYKIILHNKEEYDRYVLNPKIRPETLLVANQPVGMAGIRNWILENLVKDGEWYMLLDDNFTEFQCVPGEAYQAFSIDTKKESEVAKKLFETKVSFRRVIQVAGDSIMMAEKTGAKLIGFGSNLNFFFRSKKFREVGYVIGKMQLIKKTALRYDLNVSAMDDYCWTAQNLEVFGKVLINNYCVGVKKHYAPGGIGVYEDRLAMKLKEVDYMMKRYPGLFRYKVKTGCHPKAEIQVRFTSLSQVQKWQAFMRGLSTK